MGRGAMMGRCHLPAGIRPRLAANGERTFLHRHRHGVLACCLQKHSH